jgi:predicted  nucleic acid-binding Zn-ribbon protein
MANEELVAKFEADLTSVNAALQNKRADAEALRAQWMQAEEECRQLEARAIKLQGAIEAVQDAAS